MNIIAGWIIPEMNCARKLAWYSVSFCWSKIAADSSRLPNTLTSEWPVYISSTCALSLPVVAHCLMKLGWARFPTLPATTADSGTVTSAISASSGEIRNIMISTPITVSSDETIWDSVCCSDCARLSMSLVTRDSTSPRGWRSKYFSGSRANFSSTCSRRRYTACCTRVVVSRAWISPKNDAMTNSASTVSRIWPTLSKSMPTPGTRSTRP